MDFGKHLQEWTQVHNKFVIRKFVLNWYVEYFTMDDADEQGRYRDDLFVYLYLIKAWRYIDGTHSDL